VAVAAPSVLVRPVTRAADIAVPTNQGSSFSLLLATVEPPVLAGLVVRVLVTARPADQSSLQGRFRGRSAGDLLVQDWVPGAR